jgi:hypothetical protein
VLAFSASGHKPEGFFEAPNLGESPKFLLHPGSHDEDDIVDHGTGIENGPGVRDDRSSGHFQEELIDVWTHSGSFPGGNNDGAGTHDAIASRTSSTFS